MEKHPPQDHTYKRTPDTSHFIGTDSGFFLEFTSRLLNRKIDENEAVCYEGGFDYNWRSKLSDRSYSLVREDIDNTKSIYRLEVYRDTAVNNEQILEASYCVSEAMDSEYVIATFDKAGYFEVSSYDSPDIIDMVYDILKQHDQEEEDEKQRIETDEQFNRIIGLYILSDPTIEKKLDRAGKIKSPNERRLARNRVAQEAIRKFNDRTSEVAQDTEVGENSPEAEQLRTRLQEHQLVTPYFGAVRDAIPNLKQSTHSNKLEEYSSHVINFIVENPDKTAKIAEIAYKLGKFCFKLIKERL